jgi:hypothetical protein
MRKCAAVLLALAAACGSKSDSSSKSDDTEQATAAGPGATTRRPTPRLPPLPRRRAADGDAGTDEPRDRPSLGGSDEGGDRRFGRMQRFDTDGDGQLSEQEREAMIEERKAMMRERLEGMVTELDADKDGKLSRSEAEAAPGDQGGGADGEPRRRRGARLAERFDEIDKNKDGFLTTDEVEESMPTRGRGPWRGGQRGPGGPRPPTDNP